MILAGLYKFINIHQRAKTSLNSVAVFSGISLSIFIREPKQLHAIRDRNLCISLSIFIREPKQENQQKIDSLKLSFEDFSTLVVNAAQAVINDNEEIEGETTTPATT